MAFAMFGFASSHAQVKAVRFLFKDGKAAQYLITDLQNFTFRGDTAMVINRKSATVVAYKLDSIVSYRYFDTTITTLSISDINLVNTSDVRIYPNPFRGSVTIKYELNSAEQVGIEVFDMAGRSVKQWPTENKKAGTHEIIWQPGDNGRSLPSGTYICRIRTSKGTISKMMVME